ncbi:MAG: 6-phosphogluconate dehydrogenase (decarboxylating) [Deltaproteobacteria bacterium]|nr:MAG: 6-phosphogluconate dehydrogenase (decarboxylating) [Deltaproteobacteria bacterium]
MKLAIFGMGKMGGNMSLRLIRGGHEVVAFDLDGEAVKALVSEGAEGADSVEDALSKLPSPKIVWVMLPSGEPTETTLLHLGDLLSPKDIVIDGGNSHYKETLKHAEALESSGIHLVDVGTSGGIWGLEEGYSMMVGGDEAVVESIRPIFETLAPSPNLGWGRVGPSGAGHFVKMVHNGIEYGIMQAYAEGFELMESKEEFGLNLAQISEIWRHGSVVRSWLLDLVAGTLVDNPRLDGLAPFVPDSGEGRWTVLEGVEQGVSLPVISTALFNRFKSQDDSSYADKLLSAMRGAFGGHPVKRG